MLGAQRLVGLVIDASEELFWLIHSTWWSNFEAVLAVKENRTCSHLYAAILNIFSCEYPHFTKHTSQAREVMPTRIYTVLYNGCEIFPGHYKEHTRSQHVLCHIFQIHAFSNTQDIC